MTARIRIGTCPFCAGDLIAIAGPPAGLSPPPPPSCARCRAVVSAADPVAALRLEDWLIKLANAPDVLRGRAHHPDDCDDCEGDCP